jgi:hypothetical protein
MSSHTARLLEYLREHHLDVLQTSPNSNDDLVINKEKLLKVFTDNAIHDWAQSKKACVTVSDFSTFLMTKSFICCSDYAKKKENTKGTGHEYLPFIQHMGNIQRTPYGFLDFKNCPGDFKHFADLRTEVLLDDCVLHLIKTDAELQGFEDKDLFNVSFQVPVCGKYVDFMLPRLGIAGECQEPAHKDSPDDEYKRHLLAGQGFTPFYFREAKFNADKSVLEELWAEERAKYGVHTREQKTKFCEAENEKHREAYMKKWWMELRSLMVASALYRSTDFETYHRNYMFLKNAYFRYNKNTIELHNMDMVLKSNQLTPDQEARLHEHMENIRYMSKVYKRAIDGAQNQDTDTIGELFRWQHEEIDIQETALMDHYLSQQGLYERKLAVIEDVYNYQSVNWSLQTCIRPIEELYKLLKVDTEEKKQAIFDLVMKTTEFNKVDGEILINWKTAVLVTSMVPSSIAFKEQTDLVMFWLNTIPGICHGIIKAIKEHTATQERNMRESIEYMEYYFRNKADKDSVKQITMAQNECSKTQKANKLIREENTVLRRINKQLFYATNEMAESTEDVYQEMSTIDEEVLDDVLIKTKSIKKKLVKLKEEPTVKKIENIEKVCDDVIEMVKEKKDAIKEDMKDLSNMIKKVKKICEKVPKEEEVMEPMARRKDDNEIPEKYKPFIKYIPEGMEVNLLNVKIAADTVWIVERGVKKADKLDLSEESDVDDFDD